MIKVIESHDGDEFEILSNELVERGYKLLSSSCCYIDQHDVNYFNGIFVKDKKDETIRILREALEKIKQTNGEAMDFGDDTTIAQYGYVTSTKALKQSEDV